MDSDLLPVVLYSLERERKYYARRALRRPDKTADAWRAERLAEAIVTLDQPTQLHEGWPNPRGLDQ